MTADERIKIFVDTARSMIGTKWRHRGRKPWAVDCIGLVILSLREAGFENIADRNNYGREPWLAGLEKSLVEHLGEPVPLNEMKVGDVITLKMPNTPATSHVAIVGDYGTKGDFSLIHSHSLWGVAEHRLDQEWKSKITGVYRVWEDEE